MDAYHKNIDNANAVRALNIEPDKWNVKHLIAILKPLKKDDEKLPKKKKELRALYLQWKDRPIPVIPTMHEINPGGVEENEGVVLSDDEEGSIENDVVTAMLSLHQVVDV